MQFAVLCFFNEKFGNLFIVFVCGELSQRVQMRNVKVYTQQDSTQINLIAKNENSIKNNITQTWYKPTRFYSWNSVTFSSYAKISLSIVSEFYSSDLMLRNPRKGADT